MPTNRPTSSYCLLCDDAAPVFIGFGIMMTIGDTPHQWLFPRVAAVAHHCGAGTAAPGLRAGVPTIALRPMVTARSGRPGSLRSTTHSFATTHVGSVRMPPPKTLSPRWCPLSSPCWADLTNSRVGGISFQDLQRILQHVDEHRHPFGGDRAVHRAVVDR